jgi:hypothetical protein
MAAPTRERPSEREESLDGRGRPRSPPNLIGRNLLEDETGERITFLE